MLVYEQKARGTLGIGFACFVGAEKRMLQRFVMIMLFFATLEQAVEVG